jgi:hypothetical protein
VRCRAAAPPTGRATVATPWRRTLGHHLSGEGRHPTGKKELYRAGLPLLTVKVTSYPARQAFPPLLSDDLPDPKGPPIVGSVRPQVMAPDLTGLLRAEPQAGSVAQPQSALLGLSLRHLQALLAPAAPHPPVIDPPTFCGPHFVARHGRSFVRLCGMTHVPTPYYPQSKGRIESWPQTVRREGLRPLTPHQRHNARRRVTGLVPTYNARHAPGQAAGAGRPNHGSASAPAGQRTAGQAEGASPAAAPSAQAGTGCRLVERADLSFGAIP